MKKILLIEHCDTGVVLFQAILKERYEITVKTDLCQMEQFLTGKHFDLVVMEINKTTKDERCQHLSALELVEMIKNLAHCPVILWTTNEDVKKRHPDLKIILKPGKNKELRMLVETSI